MPEPLKRLAPRAFFFLLALVILGPILRPGYIFTLDFVGGPVPYLEISNLASSVLTYLLIYGASLIAAGWFVQKLALFLILFTAGLAMYRCVPVKKEAARYFAGFLYVVNPFVFIRLEAGHIGLLAAYACLPFAMRAVFSFFGEPDSRKAVNAGAWLGLLTLLSLHFVMVLIPFAIALLVYLFAVPASRRGTADLLKGTAIAVGAFLIVGLGWIIPLAIGAGSVSGITGPEAVEFATRSDMFYGLVPNVAAMQGFWQNQLAEPKMFGMLWIVPFFAIFGLAVFGLYSALQDDKVRPAALVVGISALFATVLALGLSSPATAWFYKFLYDSLPGFRGFREPQKFIALAAFGYAYLGSIGISKLLGGRTSAAKSVGILAAGFAFIMVGFYTFPIFWGLSGNVRVAQYPAGWEKAEAAMSADRAEGRVLFLPWHLYMPFDFINPEVPVANPANRFFSREVLRGKNIELRGAYSSSGDPEQLKTEVLLKKGAGGMSVAAPLRAMDVRYIVLVKDSDWRAYKWLYKNCGLYPVIENADMVVFRTGR